MVNMKNKMFIICLMFLLLVGCNNKKEEVPVMSNSNTKIVKSDNLSFEYASKVRLYDIVSIEDGKLTSDNILIDTYTLGKNKVLVNYKTSNHRDKFETIEYDVVDTTKPLVLISSSYSTNKGEKVNLVDKALCADNYDKRPDCKVEGEYNVNKVGTYNLKYIATDSSNNTTTKSFKLVVKEKPKNNKTSNASTPKNTVSIKDAIKKYKNENTMIGVDVSTWQDTVDWEKAKKAGVEFAMIRIGFGHNRKNQIVMDNQYKKNIENAKKAGIPVGVYFFSYAKDVYEAREQAQYVVNTLDGITLELPIAFDWENWNNFNSYNISLTDINLIADAFINEVTKHGYQGTLYSSKYYLENIWDVGSKDTWLAHYTSKKSSYSKPYTMWQFSSRGKVDGINGVVDLNVLYK